MLHFITITGRPVLIAFLTIEIKDIWYQHAVYVEMLKRSDKGMLLTDKFIEHSFINSTNSFDTFY